jgi:nucleotide-binding universal stress UspA family protein
MYQNILYPIDIVQKDSWKSSLPIVKEYAAAFNAKLHIMTAISDHGMSLISQYLPKNQANKVLQDAQDALHNFAEEHLRDANLILGNIIIKKGGAVYQSIIDTAEKINADLIMVSAHRPELRDYLLGPNAAKVVRHSKTSVLVMRY